MYFRFSDRHRRVLPLLSALPHRASHRSVHSQRVQQVDHLRSSVPDYRAAAVRQRNAEPDHLQSHVAEISHRISIHNSAVSGREDSEQRPVYCHADVH